MTHSIWLIIIKTTIQRIKEAKTLAEKAKEDAQKAHNRAIDINAKIDSISVPNLNSILQDARADGLLGKTLTGRPYW